MLKMKNFRRIQKFKNLNDEISDFKKNRLKAVLDKLKKVKLNMQIRRKSQKKVLMNIILLCVAKIELRGLKKN